MEELIDRIENKIAELIQANEQLREKIRLLSSERDQWVQECALHEQERHHLNERLEKMLSSIQEASREISLSQHQQVMAHQHPQMIIASHGMIQHEVSLESEDLGKMI